MILCKTAKNEQIINKKAILITTGMRFRVIVEKAEESGYIIECPALPGCVSESETLEEALENIKEEIQGCIEARNAQIKAKGRLIEVFV
jgi:predicted RNase H-like HicB family nuclease